MPDEAVTLIYGINHTAFDYKKHQVVSAASCTTTGLAHMIKPLLENEATSKILTASMSTVHAVTNSQSILDKTPKSGEKDLRKNRSTLNNIILTSTNAAEALGQVIPEVKDIGFMADSIRVPTNTESLIVLNATFQTHGNKNGKNAPPDHTRCSMTSIGRHRGMILSTRRLFGGAECIDRSDRNGCGGGD